MRTEAGRVDADATHAGAGVHADAEQSNAQPEPARDAARRPGRPRSERAEQAILDAAVEAIGSIADRVKGELDGLNREVEQKLHNQEQIQDALRLYSVSRGVRYWCLSSKFPLYDGAVTAEEAWVVVVPDVAVAPPARSRSSAGARCSASSPPPGHSVRCLSR